MHTANKSTLPEAEFLYSDSSTWSMDDRLYFFRCISHMVGNIDKSELCRKQLHDLHIDQMGYEARVISKCAFYEVPNALYFLNKESLKCLIEVPIPSSAITLSNRPLSVSPYRELNVRY